MNPFSPIATCSTSGESGTMEMTSSLRAATSLHESARAAPLDTASSTASAWMS
jgi:hypothetical protein